MHDYPPPPKAFHQTFIRSPFQIVIPIFATKEKELVKLEKKQEQKNPYSELVCTSKDKDLIIEIVTTVAENGKFSLLMKQSYLRNLGSEIDHVHPLKFIAVAVSTSYLRSCLIRIFDDYFKRNGFMDGLGESLTNQTNNGTMEPYLTGFAAEVGIPVAEIRIYFKEYDWEGLLRLLMNLTLQNEE